MGLPPLIELHHPDISVRLRKIDYNLISGQPQFGSVPVVGAHPLNIVEVLHHERTGDVLERLERALQFVAIGAAAEAVFVRDIGGRRSMEGVGPEWRIAKPLTQFLELPSATIVERRLAGKEFHARKARELGPLQPGSGEPVLGSEVG